MKHDTMTPTVTSTIRYMVDELDRMRPQIEAALSYTGGTHDFNDVSSMVLRGQGRMWTTPNSFIIVEKVAYPKKNVYHIFLGGGILGEIIDLHEEVIANAKADGCTALTLTGRRGWVKALEPHGWRDMHTTMMLEI